MAQEPVDEFICRQHHSFFAVLIGPVQVGKGDTVFINGFDAVVGDGDLVGIACQILYYRIGIFKRLLGMHHPVSLIEFFLQLPEVAILFQMTDLPFQGQLLLFMEKEQFFHKLASEGLRQRCEMKQEVSLAPGGFPVTIRIQATGGDDAVDMRVI